MVINMFEYKCPVCGEILSKSDRVYKCKNRHSFDIAKQGYVNLLVSQKSSKKRHGDDTLMVNSRRDFLDKGYYSQLKDALLSTLLKYSDENSVIADLGCGEGYYTDYIQKNTTSLNACGIDISKQALISASKRNKNVSYTVASTTDLPITDNYCDVITSVFAPVSISEIYRALKTDGIWIKVYPLKNHLFGLKSAVYDNPYYNEVDERIPDGFNLIEHNEIKYNIEIDANDDIMNLFRMTPYYYKTSKTDQDKINNLQFLKTELEFGINVYKK